jgi:ABC-type nickel/cobalt efflux system permease component RcnA
VALEAFSDGMLGWIVRLAGLLWLAGAFMLFRQIRAEMALDSMSASLEKVARDLEAGAGQPGATPDTVDVWIDRDDAARRGWIAAQAVILATASVAMLMLHPFAAWMAALLVLGQGGYFLWREHTARRAPSPEAAAHARPSQATVNAGWVSLAVSILVWLAAWRGVLG